MRHVSTICIVTVIAWSWVMLPSDLLAEQSLRANQEDQDTAGDDSGSTQSETSQVETQQVELEAEKIEQGPYALQFSQRDHIRIEDSARLIDINEPFTVEVWFQWTGRRGNQSFFSNKSWPGMSPDVPTDRSIGWTLRALYESGDTFQLDFTAADGRPNSAWFDIRAQARELDRGWHHLAACRTDTEIRLYLDGVSIARRRIDGVTLAPSYSDIFIGVREHHHEARWASFLLRGARLTQASLYPEPFEPNPELGPVDECVFCLDMTDVGAFEINNAARRRHNGLPNGPYWILVDPSTLPSDDE